MRERSERVEVNGMGLCLHRFEREAAPTEPAFGGERRTVLLLHGFLDAGSSWNLVAEHLVEAGYEVVAPDLRGFGGSDSVPPGAYYYFPDYVADVEALVKLLAPSWLAVVGHSMGGAVAALYAGARPERVARLVCMEGLGPVADRHEHTIERMRAWLDGLAKIEREPRRLGSLEEAAKRLGATHPRLPPELLRSRAERLVRRHEDGTLSWAWDPLHRTRSPIPFFPESFASALRAITAPVLFVSGGPTGWHPDDENERLAAIAKLERFELEDAGHMMHWTEPGAVAERLVAFFDGA
jgi:pimeloyl-ACP methyl ester carboxylesterase